MVTRREKGVLTNGDVTITNNLNISFFILLKHFSQLSYSIVWGFTPFFHIAVNDHSHKESCGDVISKRPLIAFIFFHLLGLWVDNKANAKSLIVKYQKQLKWCQFEICWVFDPPCVSSSIFHHVSQFFSLFLLFFSLSIFLSSLMSPKASWNLWCTSHVTLLE